MNPLADSMGAEMKSLIYDYLHQDINTDENFCFIIMPFNEKMNSFYLDGIVPAVKNSGYECNRADSNLGSVPIMFQIFDDILKAKVVIADITNSNPNVLYELGVCHALKRNVILIKHDFDSNPPFDLSHIRYHGYSDAESLRKKLIEILENIDMDEDLDLQESAIAKRLRKASTIYMSVNQNVLSLEEFVEIMLDLESISISDEELTLLAYCAAHYGKFMRYLCTLCSDNEVAIRSLVREAASNGTTREPWRIGAMLEHCSDSLVQKFIGLYDGPIVNAEIFPEAIANKKVVSVLEEQMRDRTLPEITYNKYLEVRKQIKKEFGE